jgi:hypothetical protein
MPVNFKLDMQKYAVGRRANSEEWNTVTRTLEGTTAVGFGVPVAAGAVAHCIVPLSATGQNVEGITEAVAILPRPGDAFAQYDNVPVMQDGVIGVQIGASAVTRGAQARFDTVNKVWTAAAQSATIATIPGAQFEEAAAANAIGLVRYVRPIPSLSVMV